MIGVLPAGAGYVVTGLVTGCAPGTVIGAGVVTGLVVGGGGLTEGFVGVTLTGVVLGKGNGVDTGLVGVTATGSAGLVAGTVIIVGVGVSGRRVTTAGVDPGFVGKTVGGLIIS